MSWPVENPILKITGEASGAITGKRFVGADFAQVDTAGDPAIGVSAHDAADTETVAVSVAGTALVECAEALTVGANVAADADGKAVAATTGDAINGVCLKATSATGEETVILLKSPALSA